MAVFKEEFLLWKQSTMTAELHNNIKEKIVGISAELLEREMPNDLRDTLIRGVYQGLMSVLEWEPKFLEVELEEEEQDDD